MVTYTPGDIVEIHLNRGGTEKYVGHTRVIGMVIPAEHKHQADTQISIAQGYCSQSHTAYGVFTIELAQVLKLKVLVEGGYGAFGRPGEKVIRGAW